MDTMYARTTLSSVRIIFVEKQSLILSVGLQDDLTDEPICVNDWDIERDGCPPGEVCYE